MHNTAYGNIFLKGKYFPAKLLIYMKLTYILLCIACLQVHASGYSQKVSISGKNLTLEQVFQVVKAQTGVDVLYNPDLATKVKPITISVKNTDLQTALKLCFQHQPIDFILKHNTIVVTQKQEDKLAENRIYELPAPAFIPISGKISSETGEPLANASVTIKGTSKGSTTNESGVFIIDAKAGDVLVVSMVGYQPFELTIGAQTTLNITLKQTETKAEEVVVVGYGKQKRQSVVSSISAISGRELQFPARNLSTNLAGQIAGLISIQRNGEPGYDNADFWIRGISTFAGGTRPLVLVDGVPRNFNDIEPDEIETFSVLKDAAATAVYGAEGANGVIIVTTKRGQARTPVITFRSETSVSRPDRLPTFVSSDQFLSLFNEALQNDGLSPIFHDTLIAKYKNNIDPDLYPNVDWIDVMLKDQTLKQRYTLNVRGGSEKAKYFVSGAYFNEEGFFKNDPRNRYKNNIGLKRFNLRSNIDMDISKSTRVTVDLSGQYLLTQYPGTGTSTIFRQMVITPPHIFPAVYSDGTISTFIQERDANMRNPYNMLVNSGYAKEWRSAIQSAVKLEQKLNFITEGLTYRALVSYDYDGFFGASRSYNPSRYYATGRDANSKLLFQRTFAGSENLSDPAESFSAEKKVYIENSLNYSRVFKKHSVGGMILYMQKESQLYNEALAFRKQGLVGRGTYSYDSRYFLEANFGYTGSETFAPGYRFGLFPAIGLAYIVSNESFYPKALKSVLNSAKLRGSVGRTGNDNTGGARFLYRPTFNSGAGGFSQGITSGGASNGYGNGLTENRFEAPFLSWEIEDKLNVGMDLGFLNNKIQLVADYFNYQRSGILLQRRTIPASVGFRSSPWDNYGQVKSWGFDGSLDANHRFANGLKLSARGTFTFTRNKITEYDELPQPHPWMAVTGTRVSENTLYIAERLYTEDDFTSVVNANGTKSYTLKPGLPISTLGGLLGPGDIKYADLNGDGKIDQFDRKRGVGNPYTPEVIYGFGFNAEYKGFYASVFFQGAGRTSVVLGGNTPEGWFPFNWGFDQSNFRQFALDRWTPSVAEKNPDYQPLMPRLHTSNSNNGNRVASTWWLRDASFLRLKNAEIGYNFSTRLLSRTKLKTARIYLMGYNLALWDKIKFWDPETGNNTAGNAYPNSRIFTLGLELSF
jgi:TonB-linked SusC/RagA family outer membrane protein